MIRRLWRALAAMRGNPTPPLHTWKIRGLTEYDALIAAHGASSWNEEAALVRDHPGQEFKVPGFCWVDGREVDFHVDYLYGSSVEGRNSPNWRERLVCPGCGMNMRQRAALHIASDALGLATGSRIYATEQVTPLFRVLARRHPRLVGSEFLGPEVAPASVNANGIRHEDLTSLSFGDASLDAILSFDVLEHVPDYHAAFRECARVLDGRGAMLFSIPFMQDRYESRVRARIEGGAVVPLEPPMYHGDPVQPENGILCYHDFGWDVLDAARSAGFADAAAIAFRSPRHGYLGGIQLLFAAWKGRAPST